MTTLEDSLGQISVDEAARRIRKIKEDADNLLTNVRSEQDVNNIEEELEKLAHSLPDKCPHPADRPPTDTAIIAYYDMLAELRKAYGRRIKQK